MKGITMEHFGTEKLKISGRKDWIIFWFFAVMIAYVAGGWFDRLADQWLRGMAGPWLADLNMPSNYGRTIAAVLLLAALAEALLFLRRKSWKAKASVLAAGVALVLTSIGVYQMHCRLIVSVLWDEDPVSMKVRTGDYQDRLAEAVPKEERQELLALCRSLEVTTDSEELEACLDWYNAERDLAGADDISLRFPRKYGHSYILNLHIQDGHIYLWRGYRGHEPMITFFEDNGLIQWVQERSAQ